MDIKGKVAIVTGASSGIGRATAQLLSQTGAKVTLASRSEEKLKTHSKNLTDSFVIPIDMSKEEDIKSMVKKTYEHFGRIDILVNNAGIGYYGPLEKIDIGKYKYLLSLNLIGPLIAMQLVVPIMRKQGGGAIVNISSGTSLMAIPGISAYSSTKRAINGISLTAKEELAKDKITVSLVYPYITKTEFSKNAMRTSSEFTQPRRSVNSDLPEFDNPELIAEKILEAIKTGAAEVYAHDWMKNNR